LIFLIISYFDSSKIFDEIIELFLLKILLFIEIFGDKYELFGKD
jgi:hypothetical protein